MQDHPRAIDLIEGIYNFLEKDLAPVLQEPLRFHTRVAANLLKIIEREIQLEPKHLLNEMERLRSLLSKSATSEDSPEELRREILKLSEELCERIRDGEADFGPWRQRIVKHIKQTLIEKLSIANPRMITAAQTKH